jgi:hypothetical protein
VFFDYFDKKNQRKPWSFLESLAAEYSLPLPRLLHRGDAVSVDELVPELHLKTKDIMSYELPEGMVYRIERKQKVDFLAKWVRSDFEPGKYFVDKGEDELVWN